MTTRAKFTAEFILNVSPDFLYNYLSTPSGLATWFADDVNINGDILTFYWEGSEERARMTSKRQGKHVKFQWVDRPNNETLAFEINQDDLDSEVAFDIA